MTKWVDVWDDTQKKIDRVALPEGGEDTPAPTVWENVSFSGTNELRWGFLGGGLLYPNLGVGGAFTARACFNGKTVKLHLRGTTGEGATFPKPDAAWTFVVSGRLVPKDRSVGSAGIWHEGQGVISGLDCRFRYKGDATPPYYYLGIFWATLNGGPGFLTGIYPANCWNKKGSYFMADITYEAE